MYTPSFATWENKDADWDSRAKPKSLFAKTSAKNFGNGGSMFGDQIPSNEEKKTVGQ